MCEDLIKATHSMAFAVGNLQDALGRSDAVEGFVLLELIEAAVKVQKRIEAFTSATMERLNDVDETADAIQEVTG